MTEHHIYYVDAAHEGARLDAFLTAHLRAHSRSRIKAFIDAGHVTVDGTVAKPALRLRRGQRLEVVVPPQPPSTVTPEEIPFPVVFEDEQLLVINKTPDLTVHPGAGRAAITRYRVLERFARYTLVEAQLITGRTHQIRVHFAHIGHPVAGDPVYAGRPDELGVGRQALHAYRLRFVHPAIGKEMAFEAPPPPDFTAAVERARAQGPARDRRKGRHR